ncbi:hypothetical protein [Stutzerimonas tarimensis]|uniref:DUF4255 domain-containing protein n=1 Tax=Stutzerimonas tarimensis TaxID=1507735 RepID=A0ABV7T6B2_9GAMM
MKQQLVELITLISSGALDERDIERIADEAALAYADPQAYLASHLGNGYEEGSRQSLGEWVLLDNLPDNVLFQAQQADELYRKIINSFGPEQPANLALPPEALTGLELLDALERIHAQLSALYPKTDGYELVEFGEPLEEGLQMVLIYTRDLPRLQALAVETGIYAAPAFENRLTELGDGEDG